ncbi:MAG TPA: Na/Pi symporter [Kiritimatiellia bacterium]|nr:Na/Pi symporter [Kiritimatiellia bacterium]
MSIQEWMLFAFRVIGGMSLFIFGMHVMTQGLRAAAGEALRVILARAARRRWEGLLLGALVGFLAHSGAATTMVAGFVNAGLMTLAESLPPMLGANVGTALSMQLISFHIGHYCWMAIGIGYIMSAVAPGRRVRESGHALLGFGLLFLGMTTISEAMAPQKELLAPLLKHIHGETWSGRLAGVGLSTLLTALVTSSGAVIGLCFALISAGVCTSFEQIFPIVVGAHIGTCIVAMTASAAMNVEARRSALGHLVFNIFNVALALAAYPVIARVMQLGGFSLSRQAANLHLLVMAVSALLVLPVTPLMARLLRVLWPSREPPAEPSYLKDELIERPEQALCATVRELRRAARICVQCMDNNAGVMLKGSRRNLRRLYADEAVINEVKIAMNYFLSRLTARRLTRRQTLFMQHLHRCMKDIERIGDHLTALADISIARLKIPAAIVDESIFRIWYDLFLAARQVLIAVEQSLDADAGDFQVRALDILNARDCYAIMSMDAKAEFAGAVADKKITASGGYFFNRYITDLDRLVRHAKNIAFSERQQDFRIKPEHFDETASPVSLQAPANLARAESYLAELQKPGDFLKRG